MEAYWQAALRLREGAPLYPAGYDRFASETYRYAPWFAVLWVPLTYLPRDAVTVGWAAVLIGATAYCGWRVMRSFNGVLAGLALLPPVFVAASFGNVQPLLVAALIWDRSPWMVGLAASLKITPILFTAGWKFRQVGLAVAFALLLWLPAPIRGAENYPISSGSLIVVPLWLHLASAAVLAGAAWRYPRHRTLLGAIAVIAAIPRFQIYDLAYLLIPAAERQRDPRA
jgi:hypothetical protein